MHKHGHYKNIFNFWHIWKKVWGRVITPLWCLKAPSPATKKWIFEFCTKFGFRNYLQTFWPQRLVKSELSLGLNLSSVPQDTLRNFWDLESIGISQKDQVIDHPVWVKFEENIRFRQGRFEVAVPWKSSFSNEQVLNNEKLAIQRLKILTPRFSREPELESRYNEK